MITTRILIKLKNLVSKAKDFGVWQLVTLKKVIYKHGGSAVFVYQTVICLFKTGNCYGFIAMCELKWAQSRLCCNGIVNPAAKLTQPRV